LPALVLIGASHFPGLPSMAHDGEGALRGAHDQVIRELTDLLRLRDNDILDLFDSAASATDQLNDFANWLRPMAAALSESETLPVLVYYIGHGGVDHQRLDYFLAIGATSDIERNRSSLSVQSVLNILAEFDERIKPFVILDACFSGSALKETSTFGKVRPVALWTSSAAQETSHFDASSTTNFSGALCHLLAEGSTQHSPMLSVRDLHGLLRVQLQRSGGARVSNPQLHELGQVAQSLLDMPLIPNRAARIDVNRPISVRRTRRREKLEDIERIDNLAIHPSGEFFSYTMEHDLFLERLTEAWPVRIGQHQVSEPNLQLKFEISGGEDAPRATRVPVPNSVFAFEGSHESRITATAFSPQGSLLLSADTTGCVIVWSVARMVEDAPTSRAEGRTLRRFWPHDDAITSIAFSPSGDRVATAGFDEVVRVWDVRELQSDADIEPISELEKKSNIQRVAKHAHDIEQIQAMAFSSSGAHLATGDQNGVVVVREIYSKLEFYRGRVHNAAVRDIKFSPLTDDTLVTASDDTRIRKIDFGVTKPAVSTLGVGPDKHTDCVNSIAISDNAELLVSSASDGWIKLWSLADERLLANVKAAFERGIDRVAFFPRRNLLASDAVFEDISIWEVANDGEFASTEFSPVNEQASD